MPLPRALTHSGIEQGHDADILREEDCATTTNWAKKTRLRVDDKIVRREDERKLECEAPVATCHVHTRISGVRNDLADFSLCPRVSPSNSRAHFEVIMPVLPLQTP